MLNDEEYQKRIQDLKDKKFKSLYFIHIPKAAGSYVRKFPIQISAHGNHEQFHSQPAHNTVKIVNGVMHSPTQLLLERGSTVVGYSMLKKDDRKLHNSLKFATVRNPFDYLISCYFSGMVGAPQNVIRCTRDHRNARIECNGCNGIGYEKFLTEFCQDRMLYLASRKNLFHQIFDDNGNCCVDLLIRTEYLAMGLNQLNSVILGRDKIECIPDKRVNQSTRRKEIDYKKFYSSDVRKALEEKVKKELDMFGYAFNGPVDERPFVFLDKDKKYDIF